MQTTMKNYKAVSRISKALREALQNTIEQHEKYSKSYFWSSGSNAHNRRSNESRFVQNHPAYSVQTKKGLLTIEPSYSESCNHCYYSLYITLTDEKGNCKSKDIRAVKALLK